MSEESHEIIHRDTVDAIARAAIAAEKPRYTGDDPAAVDTLLRGLGLDPDRCRTDGGALNPRRALTLLRDCVGCVHCGIRPCDIAAEKRDGE